MKNFFKPFLIPLALISLVSTLFQVKYCFVPAYESWLSGRQAIK